MLDLGARGSLNQNLDSTVWKLQKLQNRRERPHCVNGVRLGIVIAGVLLGGEKNLAVCAHDFIKRIYGFFASDEKRHDHIGKNNDIAERQDGENFVGTSRFGLIRMCVRHVSLLNPAAKSRHRSLSPV